MKRTAWIILLMAALLFSFAGCAAKPKTNGGSIVGTWKDTYGLTKYEFESSGKMKIQALNLGSFKGTYKIDGGQITIEYHVLLQDVKNTYDFTLDGNTLYLDDNRFIRKT